MNKMKWIRKWGISAYYFSIRDRGDYPFREPDEKDYRNSGHQSGNSKSGTASILRR